MYRMENKNRSPHQTTPKLLIIDDEEQLRSSLKKILEREGFIISTALDLPTAMKRVKSKPDLDLLLVDVVLPRTDGIEIVTQILKNYPDMDPAVIFITGEPNLGDAIRAIKIGASDYLEKPVSRSYLVDSIKKALIRKSFQLDMKKVHQEKDLILQVDEKNLQNLDFLTEFKSGIKSKLDEMRTALIELKKKYGAKFSEEEKKLLNIVAKSSNEMVWLIKKLED